PDGPSPANGGAYFIRGFLGVLQSEPLSAGPALERAVELARAAGPAPLLSRSLAMASIAARLDGRHDARRPPVVEAVARSGRSRDDRPRERCIGDADAAPGSVPRR